MKELQKPDSNSMWRLLGEAANCGEAVRITLNSEASLVQVTLLIVWHRQGYIRIPEGELQDLLVIVAEGGWDCNQQLSIVFHLLDLDLATTIAHRFYRETAAVARGAEAELLQLV